MIVINLTFCYQKMEDSCVALYCAFQKQVTSCELSTSQQLLTFLAAVNHLSGPLREHQFTCDWQISIHFVSIFQRSFAVAIIMIDGSKKTQLSVGF